MRSGLFLEHLRRFAAGVLTIYYAALLFPHFANTTFFTHLGSRKGGGVGEPLVPPKEGVRGNHWFPLLDVQTLCRGNIFQNRPIDLR